MGKLLLLIFAFLATVIYVKADNKVICYYDSRAYFREGQGKIDVPLIEPALQYCTHLIYGYAGINKDTFKLVPLNEHHDVTRDHYRQVTELKRKFPDLRVLLSVGGTADDQDVEKYLTLLETVKNRITFLNSAHTLLKTYGFDGLDLAWEFPTTKPKKIRSKVSSFFHNIKTYVAGESIKDDKVEEHKQQFTVMVREIKNVFRHDGLLLSLSVLPNVNSSAYMDTRALMQHVDFVNLWAFDYYNLKRNPKEADYPAPLYEHIGRKNYENGDALVRYWLESGAPNKKLIFAIPAFGRTWKLTENITVDDDPPFLVVDGPGEEGPYTKQEGLLSYPERCSKTLKAAGTPLQTIYDITKRYGMYGYRLPNANGEHGIWVGYEDRKTADTKAAYAKAKGLGGIAIVDLSTDDFRGVCSGDKYPILRAAKSSL